MSLSRLTLLTVLEKEILKSCQGGTAEQSRAMWQLKTTINSFFFLASALAVSHINYEKTSVEKCQKKDEHTKATRKFSQESTGGFCLEINPGSFFDQTGRQGRTRIVVVCS